MKKILALVLALLMVACCFAGCGGNKVIVAEKESAEARRRVF